MPYLTNHRIEAAADAGALARLLIDATSPLVPRLRERILTAGPAVIPPLVTFLQDIDEEGESGPDTGWASIHAIELLGELGAAEAVEPMLRILAVTEWDTIIHDRVLLFLPKIGAPVLEPALAAFATATDPELRRDYASILSKLSVEDERVYQLLVQELQRNLDYGSPAAHLADYGDPRAIPLLADTLDRYEASHSDHFMANHAVIELEEAIARLGGELTPGQKEKVRQMHALDAPKRERLLEHLNKGAARGKLEDSPTLSSGAFGPAPLPLSRAARKVGRNEPCPCGSGKKYKKCCLM